MVVKILRYEFLSGDGPDRRRALFQLTQALGKEFPPAVGSCAPGHARFYLPSQSCADLWPMQADSSLRV